MNLKHYLLGLFRGPHLNGELQQVEDAGRQAGRLLATTYADALEEEAAKVLLERQERFLGLPAPEIDGEFSVEPQSILDTKPSRKTARRKAATK